MLGPPLRRDIVIVLVAKLAVVIAAALFVFSPAQRPKVNGSAVERRLLSTSTPAPSRNLAP